MGDRVAADISATLDPSKLGDELLLQKILAALSHSLAHPAAIEDLNDRHPVATLSLLRVLISSAQSAEYRLRIQSAIDSVGQITGASM